MLTGNILGLLNDQIALEAYSSNLYLAMSSWCSKQGHQGSAAFLKAHAAEESQHMLKLFDYVNETGAMAKIAAVPAPAMDFDSLTSLFTRIYEHEKNITASINRLVDNCLKEKDFSTFNFLQWYVGEQHEEEHLFLTILEKVEMVGEEGQAIFMVDREIGTFTGR